MKHVSRFKIVLVVGILQLIVCRSPLLAQTDFQQKIDSLKQVAATVDQDSLLSEIWEKVANGFWRTGQYDTAQWYVEQAIKKTQKTNKQQLGALYQLRGILHQEKGAKDKAYKYYLKSLEFRKAAGDSAGMAYSLNTLGVINWVQGAYEEALKYYLKSLQIHKKQENLSGIASSYNNIGLCYLRMGDHLKAIHYYKKALRINKDNEFKRVLASTCNKLGALYSSLYTQPDSVKRPILEHWFPTIGGEEPFSYQRYDKALLDTAEYYKKKAYQIAKAENNKKGMHYSLNGLADILKQQNNYRDAITFYKKAAALGNEMGDPAAIMNSHKFIAKCYEKLGNIDEAYWHFKKYSATKDSFITQKKNEAIAKMEQKYQAEKKQRKIDNLEKEKKLQQARLKQHKIMLYSAGGGLLLIIIFSGILYNRFRVTRSQKQVIEDQKKLVEQKNKSITSSITYAQRIQQAVLVPDREIKKALPNSFVLLKPQSIVSGDFYYFAEVRDHVIISAIDCTGHGVPGAFMSLIGNDLLNQIVYEKELTTPSRVLNELDSQLEQALRQETDLKEELGVEQKEFVRDGMDLAFCVLHPAENVKKGKGKVTLQYAGANNPLYVVSGSRLKVEGSKIKTFQPENLQLSNLQLFELPPDKQPIGKQAEKKPFTDQSIPLHKGDTFYIFSDGYPDQFGGARGKKFMYKRFRELLLDIQDKPMDEQKKILNQAIEDWMAENDEEQIDDICVLGVRV